MVLQLGSGRFWFQCSNCVQFSVQPSWMSQVLAAVSPLVDLEDGTELFKFNVYFNSSVEMF